VRSISLLLTLGIVSLLPASPVAAQNIRETHIEPDVRGLAVAKEVVDIAFPQESRLKFFESVMTPLMAQMRAAATTVAGSERDPGLETITDRFINKALIDIKDDLAVNSPGLFAAIARAYARSFSVDELVEIKTFVSTPTGAKYIQRSPETLADPDVAAWNTAYMVRLKLKIEAARKSLVDEVAAYLKKKHDK